MNYYEIEGIYQELANKFVDIIPVEWNKILFYSEVEDGAISTYYVFYDSESNQLKESSTLTTEYGVDRKKRVMYSVELSRIIERLRNTFEKEGHEPWNMVTFILESSGKFKFDFDYINFESTDEIQRREEWEAKYL